MNTSKVQIFRRQFQGKKAIRRGNDAHFILRVNRCRVNN